MQLFKSSSSTSTFMFFLQLIIICLKVGYLPFKLLLWVQAANLLGPQSLFLLLPLFPLLLLHSLFFRKLINLTLQLLQLLTFPSFSSLRYNDPTRRPNIRALLLNSTIVLTRWSGSILSMELISVSGMVISISFLTDIFDNSIKPASSPFTPLDDPCPKNAALTFLTSLPLPGLAGYSAFLLVLPCTCTSTNDSYKFGTSVFPTAFALTTFSFLSA